MIKNPLITIIIATYNSANKLPKVLNAINNQTIEKNKYEILVVDGGSTDETLKIAKMYHCKVINNPDTEPVKAKFLGLLNSKGKYLMYLDHDEVLMDKNSLIKKIRVFEENKNIYCVVGSGYVNPDDYPFINNYINEFGDPFSFFIYRLSKDFRYFIKNMIDKFVLIKNTPDYAVLKIDNADNNILIELCAGGSIFDKKFIASKFPEVLKNPQLIPHFYYMINKLNQNLAITRNDPIMHFSSDDLKKYINKIKWRVKNNIFHIDTLGKAGFTGRVQYQSSFLKIKKLLYLPYVFSIILPLIDSLVLCATRKDFRYIIHLPLSLYTGSLIVYYLIIKQIGFTKKLRSYDEQKMIGNYENK